MEIGIESRINVLVQMIKPGTLGVFNSVPRGRASQGRGLAPYASHAPGAGGAPWETFPSAPLSAKLGETRL